MIKWQSFIYVVIFFSFSVISQDLNLTPLDVAKALRNARSNKISNRKALEESQTFLKTKVFDIIKSDLEEKKNQTIQNLEYSLKTKDDQNLSKLKDELSKIPVNLENMLFWINRYPAVLDDNDVYSFKKNDGVGTLLNEVNAYANYINMTDMMKDKGSCNELEKTQGLLDEIKCAASSTDCQQDGKNNVITRNLTLEGCTTSSPAALSTDKVNDLLDIINKLHSDDIDGKKIVSNEMNQISFIHDVYKRNALIAAQNYLHHRAILGITSDDIDKLVKLYPFAEDKNDFKSRIIKYSNDYQLSGDPKTKQSEAVEKICATLKEYNYDFEDKGNKYVEESIAYTRRCVENKGDKSKETYTICNLEAGKFYEEKRQRQKNALFEAGKITGVGALIFTKAFTDINGKDDYTNRLEPYTKDEIDKFAPKRLNPSFNCDDTKNPENFIILRSAVEQSNQLSKHYIEKNNQQFSSLFNSMSEIKKSISSNMNPSQDLIQKFRSESAQLMKLNPRALGETIMHSSRSNMVPFICDLPCERDQNTPQ